MVCKTLHAYIAYKVNVVHIALSGKHAYIWILLEVGSAGTALAAVVVEA